MDEIKLTDIDENNWEAVCELDPGRESRNFVADNAYSIVQSVYEKCWTIKAICANDKLIGFAMYGLDQEEVGGYELCRFMIDRHWQGCGFGKKALAVIIQEMFSRFQCDRIFLSTSPENYRAKALYQKMGFVPTGKVCGEEDDIEDIYCLTRPEKL